MLWFYVGKTNQYFLYRLITHDIKVSIFIIYVLTIYLIQTQTRGRESKSRDEREPRKKGRPRTKGNEHERGPTRVNQHNQAGIKERGQTGQQTNRDEHKLGPVSTNGDGQR